MRNFSKCSALHLKPSAAISSEEQAFYGLFYLYFQIEEWGWVTGCFYGVLTPGIAQQDLSTCNSSLSRKDF